MFAAFRKEAVVPPCPRGTVGDDLWTADQNDDPETVHEGLGVKHLEPMDITSRLASLMGTETHEAAQELHLPPGDSPVGSLAVARGPGRSVYGATGEEDQVAVAFVGTIENADELAELYGLDLPPPPGENNHRCPTETGAQLVHSLYVTGFQDIYGDYSDQPATILSAFAGDFAFVLFDAAAGYVLATRSASGAVPLFWGLDSDGHGVVFSTIRADRHLAYLTAFPRGCFFESQLVEGCGDSVIEAFTKPVPSARQLEASVRKDSHGHIRKLLFKTMSGARLNDDEEMDEPPLPAEPAAA
ncbi:unnamed protein product [Pedinophyceae sp. YPF-701]|nr:unnamed protein product [Pedinophyceae sp. YPF-701]